MTLSCNKRFSSYHSTINCVLTTSVGFSPFRTALTQCTSWLLYLTDLVTKQPSARSTPPSDPQREDTPETVGDVRWMAGWPSNGGNSANFLTVRRFCFVKRDIVRRET